MYTYSVCIDDFTNRNINNWFSESHQVRIFINIKFILQFRDLAGCLKKTSLKKKKKKGRGEKKNKSQDLSRSSTLPDKPKSLFFKLWYSIASYSWSALLYYMKSNLVKFNYCYWPCGHWLFFSISRTGHGSCDLVHTSRLCCNYTPHSQQSLVFFLLKDERCKMTILEWKAASTTWTANCQPALFLSTI